MSILKDIAIVMFIVSVILATMLMIPLIWDAWSSVVLSVFSGVVS